MKILAISLLRVGDIVLHNLLIKELRKQNPNAEIHILVNDVCKTYATTLSGIDKVHVFPRTNIQKFLVEENRAILCGYDLLNQAVENLNGEKFDRIINLTHTRPSARLMDLLSTKEKQGIAFQNGKMEPIKNKWLHFVNEQYSESHDPYFHYLEALGESVSIKTDNMLSSVKNTNGSRICIQVLTSDPKKNWPIRYFIELAALLKGRFPNKKITILASPQEEEFVQTAFKDVEGVELKFLKWPELKKLLTDVALLITGDTSVQHIATEFQIPVLSLFMGSANPRKTGPYLAGAMIIQARYMCTPCFHSNPCIKSNYDCCDTIVVDDVYAVSVSLIEGTALPTVQSSLFKVEKGTTNRFLLKRIGRGLEMSHVQACFEQMVWQIYLEAGHLEIPGPYGSSAYTFLEDLKSEFTSAMNYQSIYQWIQNRLERNEGDQLYLDEIDSHLLKLAGDLVNSGSEFEKNFSLEVVEIKNSLHNYLIGRLDSGDYFFQLRKGLEFEGAAFIGVRRVRTALQETKHLLQIENKFTRTLITEFKEKGLHHVTGTRTVFDHGSSAT